MAAQELQDGINTEDVPPGIPNVQPAGGAVAPAGQNNMLIQMARLELRCVDESLFTPSRVPIGPWHRPRFSETNGPVGQEIEAKKMRVFNEHFPHGYGRKDVAWSEVNQRVEESGRASHWYPANLTPSTPNDEAFITMLLHDGFYVLSSFIDYSTGVVGGVARSAPPPPPTHGGSSSTEEDSTELRDILFLLENQIPWVVLKQIHSCRCHDPSNNNVQPLQLNVERVPGLLKDPFLFISGSRTSAMPPDGPKHLLHLVHHYLKPTDDAANTVVAVGNERRHMGRWRRATEYMRYANVKLRRRHLKNGVVDSILDVRLKGRTLQIPTLRIDGQTWTLLRNLMALEEQMQMDRRPVTAYCLFMSQLACKEEDVELLQRQEILQHFLANDEEVVQGFGKLCRKVIFDIDDPRMNYLNGTWHRLQKKCRKTKNKFAGSFVQTHCGSLVQFLAFLGAVMLFVFQAAQVVIAYLAYRKQR